MISVYIARNCFREKNSDSFEKYRYYYVYSNTR